MNDNPAAIMLLTGSLSRHIVAGQPFGQWLRINKASLSLPPVVFPSGKISRHCPLGYIGDGRSLLLLLTPPRKTGGSLLETARQIADTSRWCGTEASEPVRWVALGALRKEGNYGIRVYLPKSVEHWLPKLPKSGAKGFGIFVHLLDASTVILQLDIHRK